MGLFGKVLRLPAVMREVLSLREELHQLEARMITANSRALYALRRDMLQQRAVLSALDDGKPTAGPPPAKLSPIPSLDQALEELSGMAPGAFPLWRELLDVGAKTYEGFPDHSCSVGTHEMAAMFRSFLRPYWGGHVLDIGCGPQPVPSYLRGYPLDLVHGLDPLSSPDDHPFDFVPGLAELLPWQSGQFDLVVAATSLDHVLLLDRSLAEVRRVLRPGGRFVVWVAFIPGSQRYDPHRRDIRKVDDYHLFHLDRDWFLEELQPYFDVLETFSYDEPYNSCFMCLAPVAGAGGSST